jgi:hypothetical protein
MAASLGLSRACNHPHRGVSKSASPVAAGQTRPIDVARGPLSPLAAPRFHLLIRNNSALFRVVLRFLNSREQGDFLRHITEFRQTCRRVPEKTGGLLRSCAELAAGSGQVRWPAANRAGIGARILVTAADVEILLRD